MMRTNSKPFVLALSAAALAAVLAGCAAPSESQPVASFRRPPPEVQNVGGDAVVQVSTNATGQRYLFRRDNPPVALRQASTDLVAAVPQVVGLRATALPSTSDAAAITLVETSAHNKAWGTLLDQGKRAAIEAFVKHKDMGGWLILVTDVVVSDGPDPVAPTGYRWTRDEVDRYVKCGIPATGVNDCSKTFFGAEADQVVLQGSGVTLPQ
jgi:hypothetical protein